MSYVYRNDEMFRVAATYVDNILKGANPAELPLTIWDRASSHRECNDSFGARARDFRRSSSQADVINK